MDLRWIRTFLELARLRHFGQVALSLGTTQSNVSSRLKSLEDAIGVSLVQRGGRRALRLTPAGEAFLPEAQRLMDQFDHAITAGRIAAGGGLGPVRVGYVGSAAASGVLASFVAPSASSDISLLLEEMSTTEQLEALRRGEIDIGLMRSSTSYPAGLAVHPLSREPILLAVPATSPHCGNPPSAADLAAARFASFSVSEEDEVQEHVSLIARTGGFRPSWGAPTKDYFSAMALVAAGAVVCPVPAQLVRSAPAQVVGISLRDVAADAALVAVWNPSTTTRATDVLIQAALEAFTNFTVVKAS